MLLHGFGQDRVGTKLEGCAITLADLPPGMLGGHMITQTPADCAKPIGSFAPDDVDLSIGLPVRGPFLKLL